jgi:hypothetical protein
MRKVLSLLSSILLLTTLAFSSEIDSLLNQLDVLMKSRPQLQAAKESEFKNMKVLLKEAKGKPEQEYYITKQIIQNYIPYTSDSAMYYIDKNLILAKQIKNVKMLNETRLLLTQILTSTGQYTEALDVIADIDRVTLSGNLLIEYYYWYQKLYSDLVLNGKYHEKKEKYDRLYKSYSDSLVKILDPDSDYYLELTEKKLRDSKQMEACQEINSRRLSKCNMGSRNYSIATFERSINYDILGKPELRKKFLILSAMSDIKSVTKDNASLSTLAMLLYKEKEIERPHNYIQFAFDDAVFFNSRLRFTAISNILPVIDQAYQAKTNSQKARLYILLIIISILGISFLLALLLIYKQKNKLTMIRKDLQFVNIQLKKLNEDLNSTNDKLKLTNSELAESNHVKEQYIGNFICICSSYIDKLDEFRKSVKMQITSHNLKELLEYTKSRALIENELKEFYQNFDNTFLNIYPNFVEEFNALLIEEEQILLKKGELLNVELRIFAMIRLGISDSSSIAGLLRYSVNTIYNYRVKIKNKAKVPREDFENIVRKIGVYNKIDPT